MFRKLLIANRGEIACRITRTAHRLGLEVVAVYSDADRGARHARLADEAWRIGPAAPSQSYLDIGRIVEVARRTGADAVHPGYGFLSENEDFAAACAAAGIVFVGPPSAAIAAAGSKSEAKARMNAAGVPVLPGYHGEAQTLERLEREALQLGFPFIVKPSGGGGGKGMQIVTEAAGVRPALEAAKRIAASAFGDDRLLLERYLAEPRHVEVQIFADTKGQVVSLFDRDCSVQRRHQKLIEEAPAPEIAPAVRERLHAAARTVASSIGYVGAGTVEFLLGGDQFYFMEMNTRLQVEHTVTEAITGLDLVEWQLRVAAGEPLPAAQDELEASGHAIEVRVCAEDPARDFTPSAGHLALAKWPAETAGVRVDQGFETGDEVPSHYDSLLGKVIAWGPTRQAAIARLIAALSETRIAGVATNVGWLCRALREPEFAEARLSTAFIARNAEALGRPTDVAALAPFAAAAVASARARSGSKVSPWDLADGFRSSLEFENRVQVRTHEQKFAAAARLLESGEISLTLEGQTVLVRAIAGPELSASSARFRRSDGGAAADVLIRSTTVDVWSGCEHASFQVGPESTAGAGSNADAGALSTPLPGVVVGISTAVGDAVVKGQTLMVIEAMKMEHAIRAPRDGTVRAIHYRVGDRVKENSDLLELERPASSAPADAG